MKTLPKENSMRELKKKIKLKNGVKVFSEKTRVISHIARAGKKQQQEWRANTHNSISLKYKWAAGTGL